MRGVNTSSGKVVSQLRAHTGPATSISIDPSGLYAASGGSDGRVCVWDLRQQVCWFNLHPTVLPLRASPVVVDTFCCLSCRPPCPPPPARILVTCNPFFFSLPCRSHQRAATPVARIRIEGAWYLFRGRRCLGCSSSNPSIPCLGWRRLCNFAAGPVLIGVLTHR